MLRAFLDEQREDGLVGLAATAVIYAGELPKIGRWLPRGIEPGCLSSSIHLIWRCSPQSSIAP